jgi:transketolase
MTKNNFEEIRIKARLRMLQMHYDAGVGHIGGNLSALDAMLYLHHYVMSTEDQFVLSKGHAAGALYVTLWSRGILQESDLCSFHDDGTLLSGHPPPRRLEGVPVATGSLGHGLPMACGMALARKLRKQSGRIFCLCSDGEWQEGSNWEALIFARHHNLSNLVVLVDINGLQGFGSTQAVASMNNLGKHMEAFGLRTHELDGHLEASLEQINTRSIEDRWCYLLQTVKGKGISFMENRLEWHYRSLDEASYRQALAELNS